MFWLVTWTIFSAMSAWPQAPGPTLSCVHNDVEQCKDAHFGLAKADDFSKMFETRPLKFIEWIKPLALYIQATTSLPASVFIAQAGLASDWGASSAFRNNNNIFKHMCWLPKSTLEGEVQLGERKFSYKGICGVEKTFGQIGRPFKFATPEESILAFLHVVLFSPSKQYKSLQEELKRGLKSRVPHLSNYKSAAYLLGGFSHDPKYVAHLQNVIALEKLSDLDAAQGCWQCVMFKAKEEAK